MKANEDRLMRLFEAQGRFTYSTSMVCAASLLLISLAVFVDPIEVLKLVGFPVSKLQGERGQTDLLIVRLLILVVSTFLVASQILLWKDGQIFAKLATRAKAFFAAVASLPLSTALLLSAVVASKALLQLGLYFLGYRAYAGDDFSRALRADHWLRNILPSWDLAAWLNLTSPQLPFPDYLFGLALALYGDIYVMPKIVNLLLSSILVLIAYLLGRELFGRTAGLFTAILCAFQPWVVWLGISAMTSDLTSVIAIASFGLFLLRWLNTEKPAYLIYAAGCLFVACGIRYENWLFSAIFSLLLAFRFVSALRAGGVTRQFVLLIALALAIANAYPLLHMAASYYFYGDLVPALRLQIISDGYFSLPNSEKPVAGTPGPKINILLLALTAFPLELIAIVAGITLSLKSRRDKSPGSYLVVLGVTILLFLVAFKGRLPVHGAGPERILLPYLILGLPYAALFVTRICRAAERGLPVYVVSACLVLLGVGIFDITRAFNYPAKKYDRDAFAVGWTLRMLQDIEAVPDDGKIIIEKGERWIPYPILAVANKPERFFPLQEGVIGTACGADFRTGACKEAIYGGGFSMVIASSPDRIQSLKETFAGRSWEIGKYHIFEVSSSPKLVDGNFSRSE